MTTPSCGPVLPAAPRGGSRTGMAAPGTSATARRAAAEWESDAMVLSSKLLPLSADDKSHVVANASFMRMPRREPVANVRDVGDSVLIVERWNAPQFARVDELSTPARPARGGVWCVEPPVGPVDRVLVEFGLPVSCHRWRRAALAQCR